jgi:hypothetical protein
VTYMKNGRRHHPRMDLAPAWPCRCLAGRVSELRASTCTRSHSGSLAVPGLIRHNHDFDSGWFRHSAFNMPPPAADTGLQRDLIPVNAVIGFLKRDRRLEPDEGVVVDSLRGWGLNIPVIGLGGRLIADAAARERQHHGNLLHQDSGRRCSERDGAAGKSNRRAGPSPNGPL